MREPRKFPKVLTGVMLFLMGEQELHEGSLTISDDIS